jgi:hypothetical protein
MVGRGEDGHHSDRIGNGGAERDRTADLLIANEALSQLSYSPIQADARGRTMLMPDG